MENNVKPSDGEVNISQESTLSKDTKTNNKPIKKLPKKKMNTKLIAALSIVGAFILVFAVTMLLSNRTYTASITYDVPAVEAAPAKDVTYETARSGKYVIGQSPSQYVTGNEQEFTTGSSGTYVADEDFPAGTYDIVTVSGSGNVETSGEEDTLGLNEVMGTVDDEFNTKKYDNYTFQPSEELTVDGVSVKLVPQTNDMFVIPEGTYDLVALSGTGSVTADSLNEIMGTKSSETITTRRDNYTFETGEALEVSGVNVAVEGMVPAVEAQEAYMATEMVEYDPSADATTCKLNEVEIDCTALEHYEDLFKEIELQMNTDSPMYEY